MFPRFFACLIVFAVVSTLAAETEVEKPDQNVAVALFERLMPGLKIKSLGTAEPLPDGGTRFRGENEFTFTTKSGDAIHAVAGTVSIEPTKGLVTLGNRPAVRMRTHGLIATADETRIIYWFDTGKIKASGPHRIAIGGVGKKSP